MSLSLARRPLLDAIQRELDAQPLLALVGPRGSGKSTLLRRLAGEVHGEKGLVQLEPIVATPEILREELARSLGLPSDGSHSGFRGVIEALERRSERSMLLIDDVTELRTLSHFPDVEAPLETFLDALGHAGRAVVTSRFPFWLARELPHLPLRAIPPVSAVEIAELGIVRQAEALAVATNGLVHHTIHLVETMLERGLDLERALAYELSPGGRVEIECRATLAELLLRARGYAACKAVLRILAREEGLKLTEVAKRMNRTAGSTRDYLRWLEEVDLIRAEEKRFYYVDPIVRLWCRIYGRGTPPGPAEVEAEVASHLDGLDTAMVDEGFTLPPPPSEDLVEID